MTTKNTHEHRAYGVTYEWGVRAGEAHGTSLAQRVKMSGNIKKLRKEHQLSNRSQRGLGVPFHENFPTRGPHLQIPGSRIGFA